MKEKKIYYGYFKCRMCGQEFYSFSCPTLYEATEEAKWRKDSIHYHHHDNGDIGVSDFIGFKYEEAR